MCIRDRYNVNGPATISFGQRFIVPPSSGRTIRGPLQALVLGTLSSTVYITATYTYPSLIITILEWYGEIRHIPAYLNPESESVRAKQESRESGVPLKPDLSAQGGMNVHLPPRSTALALQLN